MIHSFSRLMYLYPMFLSGTKIHVLQTYGRAINQRSTDLARKICGKYIHFACCGAHMLNHICGREDWNVVYNFTDVDLFQATDGPRDYLAFLGRIEDIKGTYEGYSGFSKVWDPLIIAGNVEPEHQEYFDTKVKPYVDDNLIRYIGPVDDAKKQQLLGGAKAFLMPIKWEEPFGIVMIEAMACGAPVLAFRRGSVPEVVAKGVGNISSSVEEMVPQVAALDCLPPKEINDFVRTNFSRQVIAAQYIDLFRQWTGK